jgi:hypothetical protein
MDMRETSAVSAAVIQTFPAIEKSRLPWDIRKTAPHDAIMMENA